VDELNAAQAQLGRALDEARAGEDRVLAAKVREEGERFVKVLNGLLAMARLHAPDNHAFDQPVRDLEGSLARLVDFIGVVHLLTVEDQVYINEIRIRLEGTDAVRDLGGKLRPHQVGGVSFHAPLSDPQIRALVSTLGAAPEGERPRGALSDALARKKLEVVELSGLHRFRMSGESPQASVRDAKAVAVRAVALIDEIVAATPEAESFREDQADMFDALGQAWLPADCNRALATWQRALDYWSGVEKSGGLLPPQAAKRDAVAQRASVLRCATG